MRTGRMRRGSSASRRFISVAIKSNRPCRISRLGPASARTSWPSHAVSVRMSRTSARAHALVRDIRTLTAWLGHDVLALAGPSLEIRQGLFDFIATEMKRREADDPRRIRPVRMALQNQRDNLLAFAGVLDDQLAAIARVHVLPEPLVREACVLHRKPRTSSAYWQGWNRLRARMDAKFHAVFNA